LVLMWQEVRLRSFTKPASAAPDAAQCSRSAAGQALRPGEKASAALHGGLFSL